MSMELEEQYDKLYRYCYFKLRSREMAEDITQEVFLRFLESRQSRRYKDTGKAMQYLYTIARNLCIDACRRKKADALRKTAVEPEELSEEDSPAGIPLSPSFQDRLLLSLDLRAALDTLDEGDRELLLLRYVNEVPVHIISALLGISRFAVYRKTEKALGQLQALLKD